MEIKYTKFFQLNSVFPKLDQTVYELRWPNFDERLFAKNQYIKRLCCYHFVCNKKQKI